MGPGPYSHQMKHELPHLQSVVEGRYVIERELGRGGMATVYLARDLRQRRRVAIKVLDPEVARALGSERFLREIGISARLTHPNILTLHESDQADGVLYYVMPYVEGESLRERIAREGHLSLDEAVAIVGQVADALDYAHAEGVIHRDIKPENILLAGDHAVVTDFGIARAVDSAGSERLTESGLAIGTPTYMSPEQVGAGRSVDARADVYSLGCVAYEMLGGEPPFTGSSPLAVMARHAVDPVPSLRTLRSTVPRGVERVIERALEKVPADRFSSAHDFAAALREASTAQAIAKEARSIHGRRTRVAAMASGLVVVVAAAGLWATRSTGGHEVRRFAVLPFEDPDGNGGEEYFMDGIHEALISNLASEGLGVIARTSVMRYQNTKEPVRQIAEELGVDAVIETSVTRTGDSISIQAGLVDGRTEQYLWSRSFGRDARQIPTLMSDMAAAITQKIAPGRASGMATQRGVPREVDPQAYDAYVEGRFYLHRFGREDLETARKYFELALARDSTYAPAWAGIGAYWGVGRQRGYFTPEQATPRVDSAAMRALALDSTLEEPHYLLAVESLYGHWDWAGAEPEFRKAIELRPDDAEARIYYAHLLCILGRPREAIEQMERARELDPLDPALEWLDGSVLTLVGRYDDAAALYREVESKSPDDPRARWLLWQTLDGAGRYDQALDEARGWALAEGDSAVVSALTSGYASGGYTGALKAAADEVVEGGVSKVGPWGAAILYATAGDGDDAMQWLERAVQAHDPAAPYLRVHPSFRRLRDDPRFQDLARRMNLPA